MKKTFQPVDPKEFPFVRSPYNYNTDAASDESGLACKDASLTQQHQAEQADINYIVKQFGVTGVLPVTPLTPRYGDFTGVGDFQSALNRVMDIQDEFDGLPADLRARFDNDPELLINFLADEHNRDEAIKLGLIDPVQEAAIAAPNEDLTPTPKEGA